MVEIKENIDNVEEFNYLYNVVGWGAYNKEISSKALKNNIYSVSVYDNNKIVGYGRIIGDGYIFIYIQDIMVSPSYQSRHIGTEIMNKLLNKIDEIKKINPDVLVYLGASLGKEKFYERFGFIKREDYGLGPGMILKN